MGHFTLYIINSLTPNDHYSGRTAPLTSKRCVLYIYSTNICIQYFKHGIYSVFFSSKCSLFHNSKVFGSCNIHIFYTVYAKIKKKIFRRQKVKQKHTNNLQNTHSIVYVVSLELKYPPPTL